MSAREWLMNLPERPCTRCHKMTIFTDICNDCDTLICNREDFEMLTDDVREMREEIDRLQKNLTKTITERNRLKQWLTENDEEFNVDGNKS